MSARVYVLLDIEDARAEQVAQVLRESPGVAMVDALEGPPDIIMVIEAEERQQLAKLTIQALGLVEATTESVCLLPVKHGLNTSNPGVIRHKP